MASDDQHHGNGPIRRREAANDPTRDAPSSHQLDEVTPDAVSPQVRSDHDGPVPGGMSADDGLGAAGGRDRSGPGGRAGAGTGDAEDAPGRGVHSTD